MNIVKANLSHKKEVLRLLDEFRTTVNKIMDPESSSESRSARDNGERLYEKLISTDDIAVFLAQEDDKYVGIITINKIPQLRKGYYIAEVEEMYVNNSYQGKEVAQKLMLAGIEWAKSNNLAYIRLESAMELPRAHAFYSKLNFREYGKAFILKLD